MKYNKVMTLNCMDHPLLVNEMGSLCDQCHERIQAVRPLIQYFTRVLGLLETHYPSRTVNLGKYGLAGHQPRYKIFHILQIKFNNITGLHQNVPALVSAVTPITYRSLFWCNTQTPL